MPKLSFELEGKAFLVTGASRGIGAGIAVKLGEAGAMVGVTHTNEKSAGAAQEVCKKIEAAGGKAVALAVDVAEEAQVQATVAKFLEAFGRLDGLVNNAGVAIDQLALRYKMDDWDRLMAVNLKGSFMMSRAVLKPMLRTGGSIVNMSSVVGEMGGLSKKMLGTFWTFSFGWLAICGIWPFSGFFSKDAILEAAHSSGHHALFWLGIIVAFMTALYMTRLYIQVFVNDPKNINIYTHAHEAPFSMLLPMMFLAVLSFGAGLVIQYGMDFGKFLGSPAALAPEARSVLDH
jgi:NAD(P)-dependent dehydrogenase (short-subunit alcohol dehydrogenase family)